MGKVRPDSNKAFNIRSNYPLRIIACLVVLFLHLLIFWDTEVSPWQWLIVVLHTLVYPHVTFVLSRTIEDENRNILIDSFLYAFSSALWGFNPFLLALFISGTNMTNLAAGGKRIFVLGALFQVLGLLMGGLFSDFYYRPELNSAAMFLAASGLLIYSVVLGSMIFNINGSLRSNKRKLSARQQDLLLMNELALTVNTKLDLDSVMKGVMNTLEKIYPFESLYVISYNSNRDILKIVGAYGKGVSQTELDAFLQLEMETVKDKYSIFVSGLEQKRIINIGELTPEWVEKGSELDKKLYDIKPSRSIAYFPVFVKDQVVAGVGFINYEKSFSLHKTDLKRISEYLIQVGTALNNVRLFEEVKLARMQAEQSEQAKSLFLANMSHEIRTPMTAILGYSEALLDKNIEEQQRNNFIQTITRSGKHLLSVINDILDISKIESSNVDVENIEIELVPILSDLEDYARLNCKEKSLDFNLQLQYPIPNVIQTDPTRLKQVLFNLSNNAIKFTHKGSVGIEVSYEYDQLLFSVSDTGIGLNTGEQEKIFDAFIQADSSTTRLFGGTGLGLSISKSLAHLMGGDLTLQSVQGKGSCFTLGIDAGEVKGDHYIENENHFKELMQQHKVCAQAKHVPKFNGKVLVAEDNAENQILIERLLTQTGLQVVLVGDGQQAIDCCEHQKFDLIFLDMQMPVMGGQEAVTIIHQLLPNIPVVAFTANVMKHQIEQYHKQGFSKVVEKPISQDQLHGVLKYFFKQQMKAGRVLIVEDNLVNQKVIKQYVYKAHDGLEIYIANHGEEALILTQEKEIDLILMDMEMPVMNGLQATKKLRGLGFEAPIYMVSGNVSLEHKQQCLEAGANGHLNKPIDKDILFELIYKTFSE